MSEKITLGAEEFVGLASLREIVGGFMHEIAQPLNAIMIASQVIQMKLQRGQAPEDEKAYSIDRLGMIASQVQRANEIMDGLRSFARGSSQRIPPPDLPELFLRVRALVGQQFISRGIELIVEEPDQGCTFNCDVQVLEAIDVLALAYVRDTVQAIGDWHVTNRATYKKSVKVRVMRSGDWSSIRMSWSHGNIPSAEALPDPPSLIGLVAARTVIASIGGALEHGEGNLTISVPWSKKP